MVRPRTSESQRRVKRGRARRSGHGTSREALAGRWNALATTAAGGHLAVPFVWASSRPEVGCGGLPQVGRNWERARRPRAFVVAIGRRAWRGARVRESDEANWNFELEVAP